MKSRKFWVKPAHESEYPSFSSFFHPGRIHRRVQWRHTGKATPSATQNTPKSFFAAATIPNPSPGTPHEPQHHPIANKFQLLNVGGFGPHQVTEINVVTPKKWGSSLNRRLHLAPQMLYPGTWTTPTSPSIPLPKECWLFPDALNEFSPLFSFIPGISGGFLGEILGSGKLP